MNAQSISQLRDLCQKVATEIVFAEPGKDVGLLPVSFLLGQLEPLVADEAAPGALFQAVRCARSWMDEILSGGGTFTGPGLQQFSGWTVWMQEAAAAIEQQRPLPPIPADWSAATPSPATGGAEASAVAANTAADETEPLLTIDDADAELLREFLNESAEHLQNIEQGVLVLEDNPTDADTLNSIFRAFHTFKGGSGILNLTVIQTLAHQLESLLEEARSGRLAITSPVIELVLEGGDTLKKFTEEIEARFSGGKPPGAILVPTLHLLARIRAILEGKPEPAAATTPVPTSFSSDAHLEAETAQEISAASLLARNDAALPAPGVAAPAPVRAGASAVPVNPVDARPVKAGAAAAVKVDTNKLDSLVDLVGELVIAQSLVVQNPALVEVANEQLTRSLAQLSRITRELQRTAMSLRMMPIRATFQKMNRLVRDTAAKMGKDIEFILEGEETELDRTIVEEIGDPLVHMIRNAIDHGIEMPAVRAKRGKPAQGTIWLRAFYQGGNIVIEIKDNGNGLDPQRLLKKAIEKGIVRPDANPSESEIFGFIFAAGFSTAEAVTDLSGRGVGMDVVRRNIEKLRGKVEIQSTLGAGSTFSIYLPLTLAIIDGLILSVGGQRYILPTLSVCESFRPTAGMISTIHGRGEMLSVRGRLCPILRLHDYFNVKPVSDDPTQCIAVVVEAGKDSRCLLVDQLLGKQEVVIKSLGETFKRNPMLAGAAILGDGRVGLILDPDALVHLTTEGRAQAA